jgi:sugar lactone lactonase YvrE
VRTALAIFGIFLALIVSYLLLWPVPIDPVAWQAPLDRGYVDPFAPNQSLQSTTAVDLGEYEGPEDATLGKDGRVYVTVNSGKVIRIQNRGVTEFADTGGRPLGIETDADGTLVVANAIDGIQRIGLDGSVTTVLDRVAGQPLVNANNLGIGPDGMIYFSQSSTKFTTPDFGGSYEASLLDIMEHGGHGNVYAFDPETGDVTQLMTGLNYANGVAVSKDGSFLLVAETGHYRISKFWLEGERRGQTEVLIDNLPGFPDNIRRGHQGRFWIGFAAPRNQLLDELSDNPQVRRIVQILPVGWRPKATRFSHVIAINGDGQVLMNLHDPSARFPTLTGVLETRDNLYLTSLFGHSLPRIKKRDL